MKKLFSFESILRLLIIEIMCLLPVASYLTWKHKNQDLNQFVHMSQDIPRACLTMCKGKQVEGFVVSEGKLKCSCAK